MSDSPHTSAYVRTGPQHVLPWENVLTGHGGGRQSLVSGPALPPRRRSWCCAGDVEGTRGAPQAIQVADRFHLLRNLADTLLPVFEHHAKVVRTAANASAVDPLAAAVSEVTPAKSEGLPEVSPGWIYRTFRLNGSLDGPTPRGPQGFLRARLSEPAAH